MPIPAQNSKSSLFVTADGKNLFVTFALVSSLFSCGDSATA